MKRLVRVRSDIEWLPKPGEGRLYITDEMPEEQTCGSAFGFTFNGDKVLLTQLRRRGWDIPGGVIDPGETAALAAVREVWEETKARVELVELIGIQELELFGPKPDRYKWPYPISRQVYFLCRLVELAAFQEDDETTGRAFFTPAEARLVPTMANHMEIYEEALRRVLQ